VEIDPPKKEKAASKGKGTLTAPSEDREKVSMLKSKGKKADALIKGHKKSIVRKNDEKMKTKTGMLIFHCLKVTALINCWVDIVDSRRRGRSHQVFQMSTEAHNKGWRRGSVQPNCWENSKGLFE